MPNINEIKNRISSVKSTKKITGAMYLISSAKMQRARENLSRVRPFFEAQMVEIKKIFEHAGDFSSPYFDVKEGGKTGYIVITADKGLAGAFNLNIMHEYEKAVRMNPNSCVYAVGDTGIRYFANHKIHVAGEFHERAPFPSHKWARKIAAAILDDYLEGEISELRIIYNDVESELTYVVKNERLLPFEHVDFGYSGEQTIEDGYSGSLSPNETEENVEYHFSKGGTELRFEQPPEEILDLIMPQYLAGCIFGALTDSFCAEQSARMAAMKAASDNADALLSELRIEFNRVRQGAITQEITEVAAGARAQKKRRQAKALQKKASVKRAI